MAGKGPAAQSVSGISLLDSFPSTWLCSPFQNSHSRAQSSFQPKHSLIWDSHPLSSPGAELGVFEGTGQGFFRSDAQGK